MDMKISPYSWFLRTRWVWLWALVVVCSVLFAEAIVSAMDWWLNREVSRNYLLTGLVASLLVSSIVVGLLLFFRQRLGDLQDSNNRLTEIVQQLKQAETEIRIAAVAFEARESMMITDAKHTILRVNKAFCESTGYRAEEVVGFTPKMLRSDRHGTEFYDDLWSAVSAQGSWKGEIWNRRKSGELYPVFLTISAVVDDAGVISHYVGSHVDISQLKEAAEEIERLAFYDPLTGLPNRRLLQDRLKMAVSTSRRNQRKGALLFIDLDNFKTLNDSLGHDFGDLLLQEVAFRLVDTVRAVDTIARLGGDEFVVVLSGLSEQDGEAAHQAESVAKKISTSLNQPYRLAGHDYHTSPSIGIVLFVSNDQSIEELLKRADIAMYQAKASGRNSIRFFDPQMQADIALRLGLEEDLRLALLQQQFLLCFQPQVDDAGHATGAEVLLRWNHPQRGWISPADFIPLAEQTGLILGIGDWVLRAACLQIDIWSGIDQFRELQLAVNVSARQFSQPDFVEQVCQIVRDSDINPNRLKLELTESAVLDDVDDAVQKMRALREFGVCFSMDDFGTGYSSLASLKKLPIDQLKIDQSFVRDIASCTDDAVIVQTIIAMAQSLGMEVIAEGVETEQQQRFLIAQGCRLFQGYLFGRPMLVEDFENWLCTQSESSEA